MAAVGVVVVLLLLPPCAATPPHLRCIQWYHAPQSTTATRAESRWGRIRGGAGRDGGERGVRVARGLAAGEQTLFEQGGAWQDERGKCERCQEGAKGCVCV